MIADNGRNYRTLPHLTQDDESFRSKFLSWDLGNLTYVDIRQYLQEKDTILVPMASLEQHGPHLPLYTDTITAVEVSKRVAEMIAVLHTPPLGWATPLNTCTRPVRDAVRLPFVVPPCSTSSMMWRVA